MTPTATKPPATAEATHPQPTATLQAAYQHCRTIAQREAKNFYYAFRILPAHKSDAMCAIYAFMRRADDISDDESMPIPARRATMAAWLAAFRDPAADDPVFVAVRDTQRRFQITDALLEELVRGTTMDLEPTASSETQTSGAAALQTFATFDELYRYCYLVASVVGLVTIRIFGYTDPRAEKLAEETGIAFQLTNILRDVKEDAERARIYLPEDRLQRFGLTPEAIVAATRAPLSAEAAEPIRALLASHVADARRYYRSSDELLPMIDADSRAALWVLTKIYSRLLDKVDAQLRSSSTVLFAKRARVPTAEKLLILGRGALQSVMHRTG